LDVFDVVYVLDVFDVVFDVVFDDVLDVFDDVLDVVLDDVFVGLDKNFCGCGFEDIFLKGFDMFRCFCVCFFIVVYF